jgi:ATP-dependent protease ClpP protease subunit
MIFGENVNRSMLKRCKVACNKEVHVSGVIDSEVADRFCKDMSDAYNTGQYYIPVIITSEGGCVYSVLQMIDFVMECKKDRIVMTIGMGPVFSAAAVLFSCGSDGYRFLSDNSTVMVHDVSISELDGKLGDIENETKELKRLNKKLYAIMSTDPDDPDFYTRKARSKHHKDWYMTPQKAKDINLANHIGIPFVTVNVAPSFSVTMNDERLDTTVAK